MIKIVFNLWNQFEASGKIDDYIAYKLTANDLEEEQTNAFYDRRDSHS